jgi:anti-sigma factor ChrR (cupin superfamily)
MALLKNPVLLKDLFKIAENQDQYAWKPFRQGIEIYNLYGGDENQPAAALLRYQAGACAPKHLHEGIEHILVLSGAQSDDQGEYPAGNLLINFPGSYHQVTSTHGCIVLAIWNKPVSFIKEKNS